MSYQYWASRSQLCLGLGRVWSSAGVALSRPNLRQCTQPQQSNYWNIRAESGLWLWGLEVNFGLLVASSRNSNCLVITADLTPLFVHIPLVCFVVVDSVTCGGRSVCWRGHGLYCPQQHQHHLLTHWSLLPHYSNPFFFFFLTFAFLLCCRWLLSPSPPLQMARLITDDPAIKATLDAVSKLDGDEWYEPIPF